MSYRAEWVNPVWDVAGFHVESQGSSIPDRLFTFVNGSEERFNRLLGADPYIEEAPVVLFHSFSRALRRAGRLFRAWRLPVGKITSWIGGGHGLGA